MLNIFYIYDDCLVLSCLLGYGEKKTIYREEVFIDKANAFVLA